MKPVLKIIKLILLIIPFCVTIILKALVVLGFIRLQFGMSEELDMDLGHIVPETSRLSNQFWDVVMGKYESQPHHAPMHLFFASISGGFKILWLLFISIFSWRSNPQ